MIRAQFLQPDKSRPASEKFLNLPEFRVLDVEHIDGTVNVYVEKRHKGEFCPACRRFTNDHRGCRS